jgi:SAM-dependent methyltransferase
MVQENLSMTRQKFELSAKALACPLCRCTELAHIDELSGKKIKLLWKEWGNEFSDDALRNLPDDVAVVLHECRQCGFAFFDASLAGGESFYRELDREGYYCPTRPEFARSIEFARQKKLKRILDVGCGSGAFLDLVKGAGFEACGIELNQSAAEKARAKGHFVFENLLHELDPVKTGGGFDLITFFQVLEHVSDPVAIMKEAKTLLNPNGFISAAVPSADGIYRLVPYDPHQWPPHHISRWRIADFTRLAEAAGMKLIESGGDILFGRQIEQAWNLHNRLAPVVGKRKLWGGKILPKVISLVYRKAGLKYIFPSWGSSIYGYFQNL